MDNDLARYYAHGWRWTLDDGRCFRTNSDGKGLWVWSADNGDWVTCPPGAVFSLPSDREAALGVLQKARMMPRELPEADEGEAS